MTRSTHRDLSVFQGRVELAPSEQTHLSELVKMLNRQADEIAHEIVRDVEEEVAGEYPLGHCWYARYALDFTKAVSNSGALWIG